MSYVWLLSEAAWGARELTWSTDTQEGEFERRRTIHVRGGKLAWNQLQERLADRPQTSVFAA